MKRAQKLALEHWDKLIIELREGWDGQGIRPNDPPELQAKRVTSVSCERTGLNFFDLCDAIVELIDVGVAQPRDHSKDGMPQLAAWNEHALRVVVQLLWEEREKNCAMREKLDKLFMLSEKVRTVFRGEET